jgi:antitoxin (DNA-binding transcriptional repressor) of toxin-antitoxin stability system
MNDSMGIRELRNSLSAVLRELRPGSVLDITDRGEVVAHLVAAGADRKRTRYQMMIEAGEIKPATAPAGWFPAWPKSKGLPLPPGTAQWLIDEDRGE